MPATYEPIATTTLGAATNSITFSSIPQTYTDLRLVWVLNGKSNTNDPGLRVNGNTGNAYSLTLMAGDGTGTVSQSYTGAMGTNYLYMYGASSTTIPHLYTYDIFSYTSSIYKSILYSASQDQNGSGTTANFIGVYNNSSAITSLTVLIYPSGNQNIGSTATLYGILKA